VADDDDDATPWPPVNARLDVRVRRRSTWLATRVEGREADLVDVAIPTNAGVIAVEAQRDDPVELRWIIDGRGLAYAEGLLVGAIEDRIPMWRIRSRPPDVQQRREFVRVPVRLTVPSRFEPLTTVDLSEGGMSCEAPAGLALREGRLLDLTLDLDGDRVDVTAEVIRVRPSGAGMVEAALRFRDVTEGEAQRIRRFVFAAQVKERADRDD
jgi:hypothetical protein